MRSRGLTLGGNMDNAIVVDDYKVLNSDGLRYDDEAWVKLVGRDSPINKTINVPAKA